ncbi:hypothetical protein [Chromohalobacter sp. 48-RD10]|uniref:hypothetical protein n=1 Tax=Chromohalobacter sp. 48-RD10 TaxID=2994063 RepID=UPI002469B699|nr:hypothetical protein [Chromohalobacter sp. 48-RD10]
MLAENHKAGVSMGKRGSFPAVAMAASILLSGCATSAMSPRDASSIPDDRLYAFQQQTGDKGVVTVTRDSGIRGSMCSVDILIDGTKAGTFSAEETARFYVEPGEHIIGATLPGGICSGGVKEVSAEVGADERKYFRISFSVSSELILQATATK